MYVIRRRISRARARVRAGIRARARARARARRARARPLLRDSGYNQALSGAGVDLGTGAGVGLGIAAGAGFGADTHAQTQTEPHPQAQPQTQSHTRTRRPQRSAATVWGLRLTAVIALIWIATPAIGFINALSALTALGFLAAAAGIRYPALGLFGVGLLVVLDPISRHLLLYSGGLLRWNTFNYWLLLVTLLFAPRVWRLTDPHSRLLQLLILILTVDLFLAHNFEAGIQTLFNVATVFALVIYFQRSPRDEHTFFWLGTTMGLAAAMGGAAFYRDASLLQSMNKNAFAMFPLAGVFGACVVFPFVARVRGGQPMLAGLAAIDVTWVFLSRSRSALILALIAMGFLVVTARTLTMRVVYLAAAAFVAVAIAAQFGALEATAAARFDKLLNANVSLEERTSGRANLMRGGWHIFLQHPFGIGTGGFEDAWSELEQPEENDRWAAGKQVPPHSAWLMVLVENGLPGIFIFAAYVGSFAVAGFHFFRRDRRLLLLGGFVSLMLAVAFTMNEFQGKALWFAAAAATALLHQHVAASPRGHPRPAARRRPLLAAPCSNTMRLDVSRYAWPSSLDRSGKAARNSSCCI